MPIDDASRAATANALDALEKVMRRSGITDEAEIERVCNAYLTGVVMACQEIGEQIAADLEKANGNGNNL